MITRERLKEVLDYDPDSGIFSWKQRVSNRIKIGDSAGSLNNRGYILIRIDKKQYLAHRLAFLFMTGDMPEEVDHENGNTSNNIFKNLRPAGRSEQLYNTCMRSDNTSGARNVYLTPAGTYQVKINVNGATKYLGTFEDFELAELVAIEARDKFHGKFAKQY